MSACLRSHNHERADTSGHRTRGTSQGTEGTDRHRGVIGGRADLGRAARGARRLGLLPGRRRHLHAGRATRPPPRVGRGGQGNPVEQRAVRGREGPDGPRAAGRHLGPRRDGRQRADGQSLRRRGRSRLLRGGRTGRAGGHARDRSRRPREEHVGVREAGPRAPGGSAGLAVGSSAPMRIVFWNIRAGGGVRIARIAAQIERWAPDAVALCEFRATPPSLELARMLATLGLPHQCTTAQSVNPTANRLFLATRWPLTRIRLYSSCADAARLMLLATIEAPEAVTLGVMHVPNRVTGRKDAFYAATLALLGRWRRGPALVVGDTNSGRPGIDEETPVFGPREDAWLSGLERSGWLDAFRLRYGP